MIDLNSLRIFETVASLRSFSAAARDLKLPKSSVSRAISLLEAELGTRLLQRTTREVALTDAGTAFKQRCEAVLCMVNETVDYVGTFGSTPRGLLKISSTIGFGVLVLSELTAAFMKAYPDVVISLELTSRVVDLVAANVDIAIRMGPMPDSQLIATGLGRLDRVLCCSPAYVSRNGCPASLESLSQNDWLEMPSVTGRPRLWNFVHAAGATKTVTITPRVWVNDSLAIYHMVLHGAGVSCLPTFLCLADIEQGRLIRVLPEWSVAPVDVQAVFPSNRELSSTVRAFVDFLKSSELLGKVLGMC